MKSEETHLAFIVESFKYQKGLQYVLQCWIGHLSMCDQYDTPVVKPGGKLTDLKREANAEVALIILSNDHQGATLLVV